MKPENENIVFNVTDEDIKGVYQDIIKINTKSHAEYIMSVLTFALKKSHKLYRHDKWHILSNYIMYKYHCILDDNCNDAELNNSFKITKKFMKEFKEMLNAFKYLFNNNIYTPEDVGDMYLYYFTLLTIHNKIIEGLDNELKRASIETLSFSAMMPYEKNIEEYTQDFSEVLKLVKKFKQEKEDN